MANNQKEDQLDLNKVKNFPKGAQIQRSKGHIYVIRRRYVFNNADGRKREIRETLGQIVDCVFYTQDEYKQLFKKGLTRRDEPRLSDVINNPKIIEGLTQTQIELLASRCVTGIVGPFPLFWQLAKNCGLYDDLLTTFTNHKLCAKILVIAIYFIVIGDNSARHISNFTETHFLPENIKLTGQLLSKFYKELSQENQFFANRFFIERAKRITENNTLLCIDSTTIATSASHYSLMQEGLDKQGVFANQINFTLVFNYNDKTPISYKVLPGNVPDYSSLEEVLQDLVVFGLGTRCIAVLDRGYCGLSNISKAQQLNVKCCFALKLNSRWAHQAVETALLNINEPENFIASGEVSCYTVKVTEKDVSNTDITFWVHVYHSYENHHNDVKDLYSKLDDFKRQWNAKCGKHMKSLLKNNLIKYFYYDKNDLSKPLLLNNHAVKNKLRYAGCFANVTTYECSALESYNTYDVRADIERVFRSGKRDINLSVLRTHSDSYCLGKIIISFISLILLAEAKKELAKSRYKIDVDVNNKTIDIYNNKYDINSVLHCTKSMQIHRNPISGECFFLHPSTKQHEIAKALGCDGLFMRKFKY